MHASSVAGTLVTIWLRNACMTNTSRARYDRCQGSCRLKLNLCCLVFYNLCFLFFRVKMNNSYRFPVSYFATPAVRVFLLRLFVHLLAFSQYSHVFTHMPLSRCDEVD